MRTSIIELFPRSKNVFSTGLCRKWSIAFITVFVFVHLAATAQNSEIQQKKIRELQISSMIGFSAGGPEKSIENNMNLSGLGDDNGGGWLGGDGKYPVITKNPVIDLEATLFFRIKHGISINAAIADYEMAAGYSSAGTGSYLRFDSKLTSYSLNYALRANNNKSIFFIGPSYMIHRIQSDEYSVDDFETINHKLGLYLGFSHQILQKPHFFLAFKANMRFTSKSEIGPYNGEEYSGTSSVTPTFKQTEVNLITFNAGIVVGLRLFNN